MPRAYRRSTPEREKLEILPKQLSTKGPPDQFTGDLWFDVIAQSEEPSRMRVNVVRFAPGALTAWHSHAAQATVDELAAELHHAGMLITEQAERIEALEAEVARLRAALADTMGAAA